MRFLALAAAIVVACSVCLLPVTLQAGTFVAGAKLWYAYWDSAILDWFSKDVAVGFNVLGVPVTSNIDTGDGYLAGPVLGYQTDDGSLSFTFAAMCFSHFSQDWTGTAGSMTLNTDVDTDRKDFDFAVVYSLAKYQDSWSFLKYLSIFGGFKYQTIDYDLSLNYSTLMGPRQFKYKLDSEVYMGTVGAAIAYPISDKFGIGLQAGIGLALPELNLIYPDGSNFDISPDATVTYNGEFTLNYMPIRSLLFQLGFRAQVWYLKARSPQRWQETESKDTTYGPTFAIVYRF
jgi:hypothetical protein